MNEAEIAELRKLRGKGMVSAVGEYTPEELWRALDEIERLRKLVPALRPYELPPLSVVRCAGFMVFAGVDYYPAGGAEDFAGIRWNLEAAKQLAAGHHLARRSGVWFHVFDLECCKIVAEGRMAPGMDAICWTDLPQPAKDE